MNAEDAARWLLMYAVVPAWIVAGLVDWWCHRRTGIERTSGLPENLFHWLLFGQAGAALVAVGVLEINAAVLLIVFAAFLAHEATTFLELRYTVPRRDVRPFEQMVHSFMEILPLLVVALLVVMAWDQVLALFGGEAVDWSLQAKREPWPLAYLVAVAAAVALLNILPLAEESLRCLRRK